MKHLKLLCLAPLLVLTSCGWDVNINDGSVSLFNYSIISQNSVIADGFTDLSVLVEVKDSNGNLVENHVPDVAQDLSSSTLNGINHTFCGATDVLGQTQCTFRSLLEGTKKFRFNDALDGSGEITFDVVFLPTRESRGQIFGVIPASVPLSATSDGGTASSSVGNIVNNPRQRMDSNTWLFRADIVVKY